MGSLEGNVALFTLTVEGCEEELRVVRFHGSEAISSLFEFRVEVAGDEIELSRLVGREATLKIGGPGEYDAPRLLDGFICQAEHVGDSRRYTLYELVIVPWIRGSGACSSAPAAGSSRTSRRRRS
jgi:type VI secretion system secreted protein VgrG